jgi:hypothetical protein
MVDSYPHTSVLGLFITYYGMLGAPFVAVISLVLNALYIRRARLTLLGVLVRSLVFLTVWMGCGVLILWDPLSSLAWLMD